MASNNFSLLAVYYTLLKPVGGGGGWERGQEPGSNEGEKSMGVGRRGGGRWDT